jgi:CheY-like chemotaxis protein
LRNIEEGGVVPCLVLLDLMMPVMNGLEFLQRLRSHPDPLVAAAQVAVVSALDEASAVQAPYRCCEVLRKPVDVDRLIDAVHRHCDAEGMRLA